MADEQLMYYRGFPLIRSGNTVFYGAGGDDFAAKLTIKDTKQMADEQVPNKVMVQVLPLKPGGDVSKGRKGDFIGFYEALDAAYVWLCEANFG